MPYASEKSRILPAITMVFLFIFANLIHLGIEQKSLEDTNESGKKFATTQYGVAVSSSIISSQPNDNFYRNPESYIGVNVTSEGLYLLNFPVTSAPNQVITSGILELTCQDVSYTDNSNNIYLYSAILYDQIDFPTVTWNDRNSTDIWTQPGITSTNDRSDWDIPSVSSSISNQLTKYTLNVTKQLQSIQISQQNNYDFVISGVGGTTQCATESNLTTNYQPQLTITTQTNQYGDGGSVTTNFVAEGAPLMKNQKLLQADTIPTISYQNLTGSNVEFQFSSSQDFRNNSEPVRVYSTVNNPFSVTGSSGEFTIPQADEFNNDSVVYYRYRSLDNTSTISNWTNSYFYLPDIHAVEQRDGTIYLELRDENFSNLGLRFIEDASVLSRTSVNTGSDSELPLIYSPSDDSIIYTKLNLQYLGLSENTTILDAKLKLTTTQNTLTSMQISSHSYSGPDWVEDEIRYGFSSIGQTWNDGGRNYIQQSTDVESVPATSLNVIDFDFDYSAQEAIQSSITKQVNLALIGLGNGETASGNNDTRFYSVEANNGHEPVVAITYNWTPNPVTQPVELTEPINGEAVWNLSGHNISGNETPIMRWNSSLNPSNGVIIQLASDEKFREIIISNDSRDGNPILIGDGSLPVSADSPLTKGQMYHWRVSNYDSYGRLSEWTYGSFLVSSLTSTYLGNGDRHELQLQLGSETGSDNLPGCRDASISSQFPTTNNFGSPYIGPSYSLSQGETVALLQCDLFNYALPPGYAVESSSITLDLINVAQSPEIGVWEGLNHQWNEQEVTWNKYDASNSWSQAGANGLDRGTILDTNLISSSSSNLIEWNVTYASQESMRNAEPLDLIFAVIPSQTSSGSALFASHFHPQATRHPILKIVYIPGSDVPPAQPILESPATGEFVYNDDFFISPDPSPEFRWNYTATVPIIGWAIELDVLDSFDSANLQSFNSWNSGGFDLTNLTFSIPSGQNQLSLGEEYHWRVRALSSTNQLGDWSQSSSFAMPDLSINQLTSDRFSVALEHLEVLPSRQLPHFVDTYLVDSPQPIFQVNHSSETTMLVGTTNVGSNASSLLRLSLDNELMPINARLVEAKLSLYSTSSSSIGESVAVRNVIPPWSDAATIDTYDGISNWSSLSGRGVGTDIGPIADIQLSTNGWMNWNITELAQIAVQNGQTSISLMLYNTNDIADRMVYFSTTEAQSNQPILELTWANGSGSQSNDYPENTYPLDGEIAWDETSHALIPNNRPVFEWTYPSVNPSPDAWRISIDKDFYNEMAGFVTYDSRQNPQYFDIINNQFTPPNDIDFSNKINWYVQPIFDDMLGQKSNKTFYYIPEDVGSELSSNTAQLSIQDGSIVGEINYPQITRDTSLDEGLPNQATDSNGLSIGNSSILNTNVSSSTALVGFNLSSIDLPNTHEIISAYLELTAISGSGVVHISASEMITNWSEQSTWNQPSINQQWLEFGALRGDDSKNPDSHLVVNNIGTFSWNVTRIVQHSNVQNIDEFSFLLQPELIFDNTGVVEGNYLFADSENPNVAIRPKLNIIYSTENSWIPPSPNSLTPTDNASIWSDDSPLPTTPDYINFQINPGLTNETAWNICRGNDTRWLFCESSNALSTDYEWDGANLIFNYTNSQDISNSVGDYWQYWRVRADQGHRIGHYSPIQKYRISSDVGFSDGNQNYTIQFYENSIFETTGSVPAVNDGGIDSIDLTNTGNDAMINVGYNPQSGGYGNALYQFDLTDVPFPQTATPTSLILQLSLQGRSNNANPITISAHECDTFSETTLDYSTKPSCSTTELTRTTITGLTGNTVEWDLTGLGQRNFLSNNYSFSIMLTVVGQNQDSEQFFTSESTTGKPQLILDYIENPNGIQAPPQVSLNQPQDGAVLYDTSDYLIQPGVLNTLSWNPIPSATSYRLFLTNSTSTVMFDSNYDLEINGNTFTPTVPFATGETYTWWVQAVNQFVPGPSSQRWNFGIGDPNHYDNNDGTITYEFQDSIEVPDFFHVNIRDTGINSAQPDNNYGIEPTIPIGKGCQGTIGSECYAVISFDASQVPIDSLQSVHSLDLVIHAETWDLTGGAYQIEFSVHEFIYTNWNEMSLTWNNTGTTPGPLAGVDYISDPIDSKIYSDIDTVLEFEVATSGMLVDDVKHYIILANPISLTTNTDGFVNVYSSDTSTPENKRPMFRLKHTNLTSIDITTTVQNPNVDNTVIFDLTSIDYNGNPIPNSLPSGATISWFTSTGSIAVNNATSAILTPTMSGQHTITACYGIICDDYIMTFSPGLPVQVFASFDENITVLSTSITADQTAEIYASAIDQYGNLVTGETIDFIASNGSIDSSNFFLPHNSGAQSISVQWDANGVILSVELSVDVQPGAPQDIELYGCDYVILADTSCQIYATVYDQFDNYVWFDEVNTYTLTTTNGEIVKILTPTPHNQPPIPQVLIGEYTGDNVGQWIIDISTNVGISSSISVDVTHGQAASIRLSASATSITADDVLYLNTTRIDVRGNELPVVIEPENWTQVADGQIIPGNPAQWLPTLQGTKDIEVSYEGFSDIISVFVSRGLIDELMIINDGETINDYQINITTDERIIVSLEAEDKNGNKWIINNANWSFSHQTHFNDNILDSSNIQQTIFDPIHSSEYPYILSVSVSEEGIIYNETFSVSVTVGDLNEIVMRAFDSNGISYETNFAFEITADEHITFDYDSFDGDGNDLDDIELRWTLINTSDQSETNITSELNQNGLVWEANNAGDWQISYYASNDRGDIFSYTFNVRVNNGVPVSLIVNQNAMTQDAGAITTLSVIAIDQDGNLFSQPVTWLENNELPKNINQTSQLGVYEFYGRVAGMYQLTAAYQTLSQSVEIEVFPQSLVSSIKYNISTTTLEQLEKITVQVNGFDEFGNSVNLPLNSRIDTTDRGEVRDLGNGVWELETLDEGPHSATIVIGSITETFTYDVEGNIAGFFAAGGPLYYVGAGLIGLIVLALLVFVIRLVRGDEDYYDDDEDEDYYQDAAAEPVTKDFSQPRISQAPTVPTPPAQPPTEEPEVVEEAEEAEDTSWMADYRVDDEGTEWGQTEDGVWYYRESGSDDWIEWTE